MFYPDKCSGCGRCRGLTVDSSDFICFNNAKEICGKTVSSDYVITEILKDLEFYKNSGGGITLSGGEPLLQFEFALDILKKAKANDLHTAIETCGFADKSKIIKIAEYTDLFLFDFKEGDPKRHKAYTGADNGLILDNLSLLNELKKDILLRCPIIPGYNDRREHLEAIGELANELSGVEKVEVEPYHPLGASKSEDIGKEYPLPDISFQKDETVKEWIEIISSKTKKEVKKA